MSPQCPHYVRTMSSQCTHYVRTFSLVRHISFARCCADIVRTYISRDICPHNVRTISFFGFQLWPFVFLANFSAMADLQVKICIFVNEIKKSAIKNRRLVIFQETVPLTCETNLQITLTAVCCDSYRVCSLNTVFFP